MESTSLQRLRTLTEQLNAETDALTDRIKSLEKTLYKMRVGVGAWLDDVVPDDDSRSGHQIGYAKIKDKWRIAARPVKIGKRGNKTSVSPLEDEDLLVLSKASRRLRLHGVQQLDALVEALTAKIEGFLEELHPPAPEEEAATDGEEVGAADLSEAANT